MTDARRHAPATERNREAIAQVLRDVLPARGTILEVASGTGEHGVYFARNFPALRWQPSDPDIEAIASILSWRAEADLGNLEAPVQLDAAAAQWPIAAADAIVCINMIHISPWQATIGLMAGAERLLTAGAPLALYGPYRRDGIETAPSNEDFNASLKSRNPEWGLRRLEDVRAEAEGRSLRFEGLIEMPANNLTIVFRRF